LDYLFRVLNLPSDKCQLRVWDLASGECQHVLTGHTGTVIAVAVAEGRVISASYDLTLRVWDLASGECQHVLTGHTGWVRAVAVAEGRVISASDDHTLRVWDLESGQEVARWEGDAGFVACDATALDISAGEGRPSLVIAAGDSGGHVHALELRGDRGRASSKIKPSVRRAQHSG
jgi:WD40 repeat protein